MMSLLAQVLQTAGMAVTEELAEDARHQWRVHRGRLCEKHDVRRNGLTTRLRLVWGESVVAVNRRSVMSRTLNLMSAN